MELGTALLSLLLASTVVEGVPSGYRDDVNWPFGMDEDTPPSPLSPSTPSPLSPSSSSSPFDCAVGCSTPLHSTLRSLFSEGVSVRGNLQETCNEYSSALSCVSSRRECESHATFDRLTSGLKYMCVEQRDAFDEIIECVDQHSAAVNEECQRFCRAETLLTGFALKDTLLKTLAPEVDAALTPNMMQFAINEGCRIAHCMLKCARPKMNARCDGTAGSLFAEALVRPLGKDVPVDSETEATLGSLSLVFSAILPTQCSFMFDDAKLDELRIGDVMDREVRRMYAEKKAAPRPEEVLVNSIFDQPSPDPWKNHRFDNQHSPLVHTKDSAFDEFSKEIDEELEREEALLREDERKAWLRKIELEGYDPEEHKSMEGSGDDVDEGSGEGSGDQMEGSGEEVRQKRTVPITTTPSSATSIEETTTLSEDDRHAYEVDHPWTEVEEGSGVARPRPPRVFFDGSTEDTTVIRLDRTADNADLFAARRIEAFRKYRIELRVAPEDQGELVCLLRTDKAHAVNRIPTKEDYELDELLEDL